MELFERIATCTSRGKINQNSPYPPDLRGQEGVFELVRDALSSGVNPNDIMPFFSDPLSGSASMAFVARIEKARAGDHYGDVQSDLALHEAFFKTAASS